MQGNVCNTYEEASTWRLIFRLRKINACARVEGLGRSHLGQADLGLSFTLNYGKS